jgi:alkylated DNA nucleotide flippase Atl1
MDFFILYCERPAMASSRAQEVAEVLWELKRADKVATFSSIAGRAGFSAGANGRTVVTCLKTVRRDWSHLHWWRAIRDDGTIEKGSEQESKLRESGFELQDAEKEAVTIASIEEHLMQWDENGKPLPTVAAS